MSFEQGRKWQRRVPEKNKSHLTGERELGGSLRFDIRKLFRQTEKQGASITFDLVFISLSKEKPREYAQTRSFPHPPTPSDSVSCKVKADCVTETCDCSRLLITHPPVKSKQTNNHHNKNTTRDVLRFSSTTSWITSAPAGVLHPTLTVTTPEMSA